VVGGRRERDRSADRLAVAGQIDRHHLETAGIEMLKRSTEVVELRAKGV
jgi:hypothetical protein